jgi:hypothetical protein
MDFDPSDRDGLRLVPTIKQSKWDGVKNEATPVSHAASPCGRGEQISDEV